MLRKTPSTLAQTSAVALASQKLTTRWITPTFIIVGMALLIRLVLMPLTYHVWDLPSLALGSRLVALGDLNVYDDGLRMWVQNGWNRPDDIVSPVSHGPFFYYLYGAWLWLAGLLRLFPVESWTNGDPAGLSALNITILKIPYLVFDLIAAFYLAGIFQGVKRHLALGLWLFAPLPIFAIYAWGQNDSFMVAAVCAALYYASKALKQPVGAADAPGPLPREAFLTMIALSIGVGFKLFPVFFIIPAALILAKRPGRKIWEDYRSIGALLVAGIGPVALFFIPLALFTKTFITSVLFSWEANLLSAVGFNSGPGYLALFWALYFGLLAYLILGTDRTKRFTFFDFTVYLSAVIFLYAIIASYPAGFLMWLLPFLVIMVTERPRLYPAYLLITLCFLIGMINRNVEISTVWFSLDKQSGLLGTGKSFLINALPWPTIINFGTALQVVALVSLFLLYSGLGHFWLAKLRQTPETSPPTHPSASSTKVFRQGLHPVWVALPLVLVFGSLLGLFFVSTNASGVRALNQPKSERSLTLLTKDTIIEQSFLAPAGKLEKIELSFATYTRYNLAKVEFVLLSDGPPLTELFRSTIESLYVKNATFYTIKLPKPLDLTKPTRLFIKLTSPDGTNLDSLGVFSASFKGIDRFEGNRQPLWSEDTYNLKDKAGLTTPALLNRQPTDQILVFRADYTVDWGAKLGLIGTYLAKTPLFSLAYYGFCFILLAGLVWAAMWKSGKYPVK